MKKLVFTVTNDLTYDQRMIRICSSLVNAGYHVTLIGRSMKDSLPLDSKVFSQKRLFCFFRTGPLFYAEYNLRLFFYLLFKKMDLICAIDLDTILPCLIVSIIRKKCRVYDAHELFCEMQEIVERPFIYRIWKLIERMSVPQFKFGYTVNQPIVEEFSKMYNRKYQVIRNMPLLQPFVEPEKKEKYIFYQGAVNEGRSFETLIPAMSKVQARLLIAGDGNYLDQAKRLVESWQLQDRIVFLGKIRPEQLRNFTQKAWVGITLFDSKGLSNYYSLANRYFDYLHAGIPQLCVDYPVYRALNNKLPVALLISDLSVENIATNLNHLLENDVLYQELHKNCLLQRQKMNWQEEEKKLIEYYQSIIRP